MMRLTEEHIEHIQAQVKLLETTEDLAKLLQWVYDELYPAAKPKVKIYAKHLSYYAFIAKERYVDFTIPKKSGGERKIRAPHYKLKTIQKCLNTVLNAIFKPHRAACGFVPGKSVVDNAQLHINKLLVYNIDLKDFFPSVSFRRVKTVLELEPIGLNDKLAFLVANLCCEGGFLPQGAPTSPTLTNVVSQRLDRKLQRLAKNHKANYSRYADDITFSSFKDVFDESFRNNMLAIISEEGFEMNESKERLLDRTRRQEVTGIVVNQKSNVNRQFYKDIRYWLRTWKTFGEKATQEDFSQRYARKKGKLKRGGVTPSFKDYLLGKIRYFGMVRGLDDGIYRKLIAEFYLEMYTVSSAIGSMESPNTSQFLDIWQEKGLDEAIDLFKQAQENSAANEQKQS